MNFKFLFCNLIAKKREKRVQQNAKDNRKGDNLLFFIFFVLLWYFLFRATYFRPAQNATYRNSSADAAKQSYVSTALAVSERLNFVLFAFHIANTNSDDNYKKTRASRILNKRGKQAFLTRFPYAFLEGLSSSQKCFPNKPAAYLKAHFTFY